MYKFANQTELLTHARNHVNERVASLESDARHCLPVDPNDPRIAPFPILLYCFATVDMLGALLAGNAGKHAPTTEQSIKYMTRFMDYSLENANILIESFRHKLVHLAQPNAVGRHGSETLTWKHHHNDRQFHLIKAPFQQGKEIDGIPSDWHIPVTHEFHISIMDFVNDIKQSATKPNGYLDMLQSSPYLQTNYETAINQIYGEI